MEIFVQWKRTLGWVCLLVLFLGTSPVFSQADPPLAAATTAAAQPATEAAATTAVPMPAANIASNDTGGSCPSSSQVSGPLTINNYACNGCGGGSSSGGSSSGGSSSGSSDIVSDDLEALKTRVQLLEARVEAQGSGGGGGGGGGGGPVGGDPRRLGVKDCADVRRKFGNNTNGAYEVWPRGAAGSFHVLCWFDGDNAWTVIQNRVNGDTDFQRSWNEYKRGFGTLALDSNFWLGLENIYSLTSLGPQYKLRVDFEDFDGETKFAEYGLFTVGPESDRYRLVVFFYTGTAGDALGSYHNYIPFSTVDMDNDYAAQNCPLEHGGGWWYRDCDNANLNGQYNEDPVLNGPVDVGIEWDTYMPRRSLKTTRMSIIRSQSGDQG